MDRILKATTLVAATIVLLGCCFVTTGQAYAQDAPAGKPLQVKYAGNTAEPYTVFVDSEKYAISQSYSWVRDEASRYSLVSYSIDDGAYIDIPRKARGSFVLDVPMDSARTVIFQASVQFPVSALTDHGDLVVIFSPASPTGDDWFDVGSAITITVSNKENSALPDVRHQIVSWSLDNSKRPVESDVESSFTTPPIQVTAPYQAKFVSQTQYYVRVVTDHGTGIGEGWYDEGSPATISVSNEDELLIMQVFDGWEESSGIQLEEKFETFLVDSPKTLTAKWSPDYSRLAGIAMASIGATVAVILFKKRSSNAAERTSAKVHASSTYKFQQQVSPSSPLLAFQQSPEVAQKNKAAANNDNSNYSKEMMGYALEKSIEKLQALRSSGLVSDTKFSKVTEKLRQAFD